MKIAILGAGAFGTALGGILADNSYDIDYFDVKIGQRKLSDVLDGAGMMLLVVPSFAVEDILPQLPADIPLTVATKGILGDRMFEKFQKVAVLSGPGFADEIKAHKKTRLTVTDRTLTEMFAADYMEFDYTEDKKGVLMCGALKNVYAIYAGIKGLKRQTPELDAYIKAVSDEMREILAANGARSGTVDCFCGVDDLVLTCGYPSRNYEFGDIYRQDKNYRAEKTVEGISALERIRRGEMVVPGGAMLLKELLEISKNFGFSE